MIDGRIKFRHLQCFLAVANTSSLQKAAVALCISQPAVSKTVKELEDILKIRLFDRGRRGAQLTQQGDVFFAYAEAAVDALQQAAHCMDPTNIDASPLIRIGATPAMTAAFVPRALMTFSAVVPHAQVSIATGTTSYLMEQLRLGELDLLLCRHVDPEQMAGLSFEFLYADPLVVVVRPGHPLLAPSGGQQARQYTFVLPPKTSINRSAAAPVAMALGIGPVTNFIESLSISFGRSYTTNTDAVWFVPWGAVKLDVERGVLVRLAPPLRAGDEAIGLMARSTGLMMRSNRVPDPATRTLINAIRTAALECRMEVF
jgi:LysR family pca operon transcriptional activator